jgi:peptide/nickel transport system substrate-binding protein
MASTNNSGAAQAHRAVSRREFLGASAMGLSSALMTAAGAEGTSAAETPRNGGVLRVGSAGGSTSDALDPRTWTDSVTLMCGFTACNLLVENGANNTPVPELAESWEAKKGASDWVLDLRKGVQFSNGKEFDANDALYSLNLHRGDTKSGAAGPMKIIKDITKLDTHQIRIVLESGDADLPYVLSDYHLVMVPNGHSDWSKLIGTGVMSIERFDPGVAVQFKRERAYWKSDRGWLNGMTITVINDSSARLNALMSGQVDSIHRVDPRAVQLIKKNPGLAIVQAPGGWHAILPMFCDTAPYSNPDIRLALKYALDREQILKALLSSYGSLGNDHPIPKSDPYFNTQLAQRSHDPEKAAFHFKKAGLPDVKIVLSASDAAFDGAVNEAQLLQASAAQAGVKIDVKKEPADGFWSDVWLKAPFITSYWGGRPAATQMLGVAYKSDAPWNDTHWKNEQFDKLLADARQEIGHDKRKDYIWEMQAMLHEDGGALIPVFRDWIDAHSSKVGGHTPHAGFDFDNGRLAEKAWLNA